MTDLSKKLVTRGIIFVVLLLVIAVVGNFVTTSVGPTITDEVALEQMRDTDAGHVTMRAYSTASNDVRTYVMPAVALGFALILFVGPIKEVYNRNVKKKKETPSQ